MNVNKTNKSKMQVKNLFDNFQIDKGQNECLLDQLV